MKKSNQFTPNPKMPIPQQTSVRVRPVAEQNEPSMAAALLVATFGTISKRTIAIACFVAGALFGLVVLGWYVWPVEWTGMSYTELTPADKGLLIEVASDLAVYEADNPSLIELQQRWPELDDLACYLVNNQQVTPEDEIKLVYLAYKLNKRGCDE